MASLKRTGIRASRQPRRHLAFVLLAAAVPCLAAGCGPTYGPGSGTLTGIVTGCTSAEVKASGALPDPSRVVTVSVQNQAGKTVASQRLPLRTSGARYRMRLMAGAYSINAVSGSGDSSAGDNATVTEGETTEVDFNDDDGDGCVGLLSAPARPDSSRGSDLSPIWGSFPPPPASSPTGSPTPFEQPLVPAPRPYLWAGFPSNRGDFGGVE